jgi:tetratricopeptide (TPR) repeat protein
MLGNPQRALSMYADLKKTLLEDCSKPEIQNAILYYTGRLLLQQGLISSALQRHKENLPPKGLGDFYQLRSRFEIAQILFFIEDFKQSWEMFQNLWQLLKDVKGQDVFASEVLKFLGTFEAIHVIYDLPCSPVLSSQWRPGDPFKCIKYADSCCQYAEKANYDDSKAWALAVKAFGLECLGRYSEANSSYKASLKMCEYRTSRRSSYLHVSVYFAGFLRRRKQFKKAEELLYNELSKLTKNSRARDCGRIFEELYLIQNLQGRIKKSQELLKKAVKYYVQEPEFHPWSDWPIVQRLRNVCGTQNMQYEKLID